MRHVKIKGEKMGKDEWVKLLNFKIEKRMRKVLKNFFEKARPKHLLYYRNVVWGYLVMSHDFSS